MIDIEVRGMDASALSVDRYWFCSWTIVRVEGEMDVEARPIIDELLGGEVSHLAFELGGVTFMDACGLSILLDRGRRAREAGGFVQLVAPSEPVRRLLTLTDSERHFPPIVTDEMAVAVLLATDPWSVF
jgi:anti-anti-sigma factor